MKVSILATSLSKIGILRDILRYIRTPDDWERQVTGL